MFSVRSNGIHFISFRNSEFTATSSSLHLKPRTHRANDKLHSDGVKTLIWSLAIALQEAAKPARYTIDIPLDYGQ